MDSLEKNKYKYVKNMLSLDIVDFLSTWSIQNFKITPDPQAPMSFSVHSDDSQIYTHVLHYLKPIMEKETGLNLKPTYSYNRVYVGGSSLEKHKDRGECEISASICLKYHYEDKNYKWPLYMQDTPIIIKEGDGVIYKGCEIEHWRPVFNQPQKCWHHQLFIHYLTTSN
jgi:hypothetical protein|tara:strand:+ start:2797 stop:3303 length:507 start_codon:yes stop_codon:yes gene_type:complete